MDQKDNCKPEKDVSPQLTIVDLSEDRASPNATDAPGILCVSSDAIAPAAKVEETGAVPGIELGQPYHVFSKGRKRLLVGVIGVAGLFSGLSSNIYFPSLDAIAKVSQLRASFGHC